MAESEKSPTTPGKSVGPGKAAMAGEVIANLLVREGRLSEEKLRYAKRVRLKISSPKSLVQVLSELDIVPLAEVREVLRKNPVDLRIGDLLVELGYLTANDLTAAISIQREAKDEGKPRRLGQVLVEEHFLEEDPLCQVLSLQLCLPYRQVDDQKINKDLLPPRALKICSENLFIPMREEDGSTLVLFADPTAQSDMEKAQSLFGKDFKIGVTTTHAIMEALDRIEKVRTQGTRVTDEKTAMGMVEKIIEDAIVAGVSDIHIEPLNDKLRIRFRLDGVMVPYREYSLDVAPSITSRLKIIAEADIAERRRHQDGRIMFQRPGSGEEVDLRVSFYVTINGEKTVLRILSKKQQYLQVDKIGMAPRMLERFREDALDFPSGVLIITGPTGSGKTTTLYSCLDYLNDISTSIITAEDPVEYIMDGVAQCSINPKIGLTFEETLRHVLRQDPDIVVLGEIRDNFSAATAIQAALTGHKVLTTFHTEDSIGGLLRLLNMDIEAFLISSTVLCVVAQRLLRRVCSKCGESYIPTPDEVRKAGLSATDVPSCTFKKGRGCRACSFTGYKGRLGVYELLVLDEMVKDAVLNRRTAYEIRRISVENSGLVTLLEDGLVKAAQGHTTLEEVSRMLPRLTTPRPVQELKRLLGYKS